MVVPAGRGRAVTRVASLVLLEEGTGVARGRMKGDWDLRFARSEE